jgi:predicted integral membrane protein DUF2269
MGVAAEIQLYDLVLFVHITAVVVAFGATFAYPFFQTGVERLSPRSVPAMLHAMHTTSRYVVTPGSFVVLGSGTYLTIDRWDFRELFVIAGLAIVVVLVVVGATFFDRHEARAIALAERDVAAAGARDVVLSEDYWEVSKRFGRVGAAASLLIVIAVFFMVVKP